LFVARSLVSADHNFLKVTFEVQLNSLPEVISYSPLTVPVSSGKSSVVLTRRDHFDARFQFIQQDGEGVVCATANQPETESGGDAPGRAKDALGFLDAPSDLVPWVYEGGLKTWECSLDLVDYLDGLHGHGVGAWARGKKISEVSQLTLC
jgi:protein-histidine N-methyltransferase